MENILSLLQMIFDTVAKYIKLVLEHLLSGSNESEE